MPEQTEYRPLFELKEIKEDGTFTGIASVYGIEDLGGDVIDKGAFRKTISENPTIPILWQHKSDEVIGSGMVKEWQGKLMLEAQLDLEDSTGQKAYRKLKNGLIRGLSIGFSTVKSTWEDVEGRMIRHIGELKLWEVSIVTFPMLPAAQVTRVKSADQERIEELERLLALTKATPVEGTPDDTGAGDGNGAAKPSPEPLTHSKLKPIVQSALDLIRKGV